MIRAPALIPPVIVADRFLSRLIGWIGRREAPLELLLIPHCRSVHTCFMRFPIDLIFISADRRVVRLVRGLRPWRMVTCVSARAVIEAPFGWIDDAGLVCGDGVDTLVRPGWAVTAKELTG